MENQNSAQPGPSAASSGSQYDNCQTPEAAARTHDYFAAKRALVAVQEERRKQEEKWGQQNHDPFTYLTILMEEVGELSQAALHTKFGGRAASGLMEEAVQTAAVALAIVECLERRKWRWPETPEIN